MAKLSPKKEKFVNEYLKDFNATQAAIRAGYSEKTARSQGQRLLTNADVKQGIAEKNKKLTKNIRLTMTAFAKKWQSLPLFLYLNWVIKKQASKPKTR